MVRWGGVNYQQVRHALYCKLCKDTLQSNHTRDFKMCTCGSIGIDGGIEGRCIGDIETMESRSMYCAYFGKTLIWLPQDIVETIFLQKQKLMRQKLSQNQ